MVMKCTGCSESFIRSSSPFTSDVILNMISLEYDDTSMAASGAPLEEHLEKIIKEKAGKYILAVEGGVPLDEDGVYCTVGGRTFKESLLEAAKVQQQSLNMVLAHLGVVFKRLNQIQQIQYLYLLLYLVSPIIKVPGCPPIPEGYDWCNYALCIIR